MANGFKNLSSVKKAAQEGPAWLRDPVQRHIEDIENHAEKMIDERKTADTEILVQGLRRHLPSPLCKRAIESTFSAEHSRLDMTATPQKIQARFDTMSVKRTTV